MLGESAFKRMPEPVQSVLRVLWKIILGAAVTALGVFLGRRFFEPQWENIISYTGTLFYMVILLFNPVFAFLLWITVAPFFGFAGLHISLGPGIPDLSLSRLIIVVLVALVLAEAATGRRRLVPVTRADVFVLLSLIGIGSSIFSSVSKQASLAWFFESFFMPAVAYWLARNFVKDEKTWVGAQRALVAAGFLIALVVLQEQMMGYTWFPTEGSSQYGRHLHRVTGLLGNPAFHGVVLAMALPFAWRAMLENPHRWRRRAMLLVIGTMYAGLFLTYNRTAWAGGALGILLFLLFYPRFRRPFLKLTPLLALIIALNWGSISTSYAFTERLFAVNPITYRIEAYKKAWEVFLTHRVIGVGFGNLWYYAGIETPHNSFLWVLVTAGLVGFIPYFGTFLTFFLDSFVLYFKAPTLPGADRSILVAFWVALGAYLGQVIAVDMLYGIYPNIVFFFIAGAVLGYHEAVLQRTKSSNRPVRVKGVLPT